FETSEPTEPFASETVWSAMSPEQRTKADKVRIAMAEQLEDHGVTSESLRVVMTETEEGNKVFTLLHTGNSVDIGDHGKDYDETRSYNSVMAKKNDKLFIVKIDGQTYDVRKGITASVYGALYKDLVERDATLPDSQTMAEENDDLWTWTMLTGEPLTAGGCVQLRYVGDGGVDGGVARTDGDSRTLRVRPAVVIE
ncbi:MAG TPA: hypothetical protein VGF75_04220, partial [Candidatus Saccharimonadales bacterium]